mmetsp:Transcript_31909/g.75814  ORF Transcript_31909/g.75814 Transcript_31909/m.75814 type:complete len:323 (-) Transcript_31909:1318-2286(-)
MRLRSRRVTVSGGPIPPRGARPRWGRGWRVPARRSVPDHPPDVHAAEVLAVDGLLDEAVRVALRGERQARLGADADECSIEAALGDAERVPRLRVLQLGSRGLGRARLVPLHQRVVDKGLEDAQDGLTVGSQHLEGYPADAPEDTLDPARPKGVDQVLGEAERHHLGLLQGEPLVEEAAEVDVHAVAGRAVDEEVLAVAVPEAEDVADHRPHRRGAREPQPRVGPPRRRREHLEEPVVQHRGEHGSHLVVPSHPVPPGGLVVLVEDLLDGLQGLLVVHPERRVRRRAAVAEPHGVVHPLHDAAVLRERHHAERPKVQVPLPA